MGSKKEMTYASRIWNKIRYGMALQVLRNYLAKSGPEITPYYLLMEKPSDSASAEPQNNFSEYSLEFFRPNEMKVMAAIPGRKYISEEYMPSKLNEGKKCLGIKYQGQIASFTWFDFEECSFKGTKFFLIELLGKYRRHWTIKNYG